MMALNPCALAPYNAVGRKGSAKPLVKVYSTTLAHLRTDVGLCSERQQ
jgi:hypothetical protein